MVVQDVPGGDQASPCDPPAWVDRTAPRLAIFDHGSLPARSRVAAVLEFISVVDGLFGLY